MAMVGFTGFPSEVTLAVAAPDLGAAAGAGAATVVVVLAPAGTLGLLADGAPLTSAAGGPRALGALLAVADGPMLRACVDAASLLAFSRIARCFSSSLAKIGTKSSGIGLLS